MAVIDVPTQCVDDPTMHIRGTDVVVLRQDIDNKKNLAVMLRGLLLTPSGLPGLLYATFLI